MDAMRRFLTIGLATVLALAVAAPASAEPPVHDSFVVKDVAITVPPPTDCPGPATTIDIVFNQQSHVIFTEDSFHVSDTMSGTWVSRDAGGAMLASGHFVTRTSTQGPGFPTLVDTTLLIATGTTVDGDQVLVHVLRHLTITPSGDVVSEFEQISCTP
jgi:hypothetical protein